MSLRKRVGFTCMILLASFLLLEAGSGWSQGFPKVKAPSSSKEEKIPKDLAPEKVDSYLAGLSDEQARRLLASELRQKAQEQSGEKTKDGAIEKETGFALVFFTAQRALATLAGQLSGIISGAHTSADSDVWEKLVGGRGFIPFLTSMALLVLIILTGLAAERLLLWKTEPFRSKLLVQIPRGGWEKAGALLSGLVLDIIGIGVYILMTFLGFFLVGELRPQPAHLISSVIILTYYLRMLEMGARLVASPKSPELRLLEMSDSDARHLYNWLILITAAVIPGAVLALALKKAGASRELFLFIYSTAGPIVSILVAIMIWQTRHRVSRLICPIDDMGANDAGRLRQRCGEYWHYPATLFVLAVGGYWWVRALTHGDATILRLVLSLFVLPICLGMDQWMQQMLARLWGKPREVIDFSMHPEEERHQEVQESEGEPAAQESQTGEAAQKPIDGDIDRSPVVPRASGTDMSIYFPLVRKASRIVLLIFLFFATLKLWGIEFDIGWIFAKSVLGVIIASVLGLIVWEVVKVRIDQRLEMEMPLQSDEAEEGGSGGSRSGTLLMLLRKTILVFLVVVVGFSVMASLGVNIAPLLAGAGVVGLAIGFGSQTLVKDIIAGIFFLIDDAFRVGDYVEAGAAKGTVEHISLRSLRLRHPRGQVFVVPFGDLKMVQNFTRDYIIEKLDIRVRFDTDPDVIRKIVKKINKEVMAEEELSGALLGPIKSVGVRAMDDSAMIMRVKFKCIPGEQYILRREVFQRIQKAFKAKGIEFAHRNVTVYLPPQPSSSSPSAPAASSGEEQNSSLAIAGAAAAAAIAQAEAEALALLNAKKKPE